MKKARDKSELENSTLLNPSSILFSTDGQAHSSVKELYSSKYIVFVQERKRKEEKKKMKPRYQQFYREPLHFPKERNVAVLL